MKKIYLVMLSGVLLCSAVPAFAEAPTDNMPPAHEQKNQVPDTTKNGDYLEPQSNNNGTKASGDRSGNSSRPGNMQKSKRFQQSPAEGGTDVNQNKR